jgi:hypothetical protein
MSAIDTSGGEERSDSGNIVEDELEEITEQATAVTAPAKADRRAGRP